MNMKLTVIHAGETDGGKKLSIGDQVEYVAHVPGGMVRVKFADGSIGIAHPSCFKELA